RLDGEGVDVEAVVVGDEEVGLVGGEGDAVGGFDAGVYGADFPGFGIDEGDLLLAGFGEVAVAYVGDDEVVGGDFFGEDGGAIGGEIVRDEAAIADGVEFVVGAELDAAAGDVEDFGFGAV